MAANIFKIDLFSVFNVNMNQMNIRHCVEYKSKVYCVLKIYEKVNGYMDADLMWSNER